jgi:hypothetical protein
MLHLREVAVRESTITATPQGLTLRVQAYAKEGARDLCGFKLETPGWCGVVEMIPAQGDLSFEEDAKTEAVNRKVAREAEEFVAEIKRKRGRPPKNPPPVESVGSEAVQ